MIDIDITINIQMRRSGTQEQKYQNEHKVSKSAKFGTILKNLHLKMTLLLGDEFLWK